MKLRTMLIGMIATVFATLASAEVLVNGVSTDLTTGGNNTFTGDNTFVGPVFVPVVPTATNSAASKAYVDASGGSSSPNAAAITNRTAVPVSDWGAATASLRPAVSGAVDVGSANYPFRAIYADDVKVSGSSIYMNGIKIFSIDPATSNLITTAQIVYQPTNALAPISYLTNGTPVVQFGTLTVTSLYAQVAYITNLYVTNLWTVYTSLWVQGDARIDGTTTSAWYRGSGYYLFDLNGTNLLDNTVNSNKFDAVTRALLGGSAVYASIAGTASNLTPASSTIPIASNVYDLGSALYPFRSMYASSINIGLTNGPIVDQVVMDEFSILDSGYAAVAGKLSPTSSIIPAVSNAYDLGSPDFPFRDLYISTNSIYMGGQKALTYDPVTTQIVASVPIVQQTSPTNTNTIAYVSVTGTPTNNQVIAWNAVGGQWNPTNQSGSAQTTQVYCAQAGYAGVAGTASNLNMASSVIPNASNAYDIGSANFPVRDLFLGSNSIYMGGQRVLKYDTSTGKLITTVPLGIQVNGATSQVAYVTNGAPISGLHNDSGYLQSIIGEVDNFTIVPANGKIKVADRIEAKADLALFYRSADKSQSAYGLYNTWLDSFVDETGVNTSASTGEVYDGIGRFYHNASAIIPNYALYFSGAAYTQVKFTNSPFLPNSDVGCSLSVWVKVENKQYQTIWYMGTGGGGLHQRLQWSSVNMDGTTHFGIVGAPWTANLSVDIDYDANKWVHIVCTFTNDAAGTVMYTNGVFAGAGTGGNTTFTTTESSGMGQLGDGDGGRNYQGCIDQLAIWKRVLSPSEVTALYNNGNGVRRTESTVFNTASAVWEMEENTGTTISDPISGINGDFSGMNVSWTNKPVSRAGYALDFDGVSGTYAVCGDTNLWGNANTAQSFAYSFWFTNNADGNIMLLTYWKPSVALQASISYGWQSGGWDWFVGSSDWQGCAKDPTAVGWHNIIVSVTGTTMNAWYDGEHIGIDIATGTMSAPDATSRTSLGGEDSGVQWLQGKMDEFVIYNRALSAPEATNIYSSGLGVYTAVGDSKVSHAWHFDENTGTTPTDAYGTNQFTMLAGTTWASSPVCLNSGTVVVADMTLISKAFPVINTPTNFRVAGYVENVSPAIVLNSDFSMDVTRDGTNWYASTLNYDGVYSNNVYIISGTGTFSSVAHTNTAVRARLRNGKEINVYGWHFAVE